MLTSKDFINPGNSKAKLESKLIELWCEVLKLEEIDADEDFFELGGDSVQAAVIANRLQAMLQIELPVSAALRTPTVEGLAAYLEENFSDEVNQYLASN